MTTNVDELLQIAREIIGKTKYCFSITLSDGGEMSARVVQPGPLDDDWRVWYLTSRKSRKVLEIEATGQQLLGYQYDPDGAHVTLHGDTAIIDDLEVKRSVWTEDAYRWYPGGPEDPDVVLVELKATRIELWSAAHKVWPGISSVVLSRDGDTWS